MPNITSIVTKRETVARLNAADAYADQRLSEERETLDPNEQRAVDRIIKAMEQDKQTGKADAAA